jgi:hypothetical protein
MNSAFGYRALHANTTGTENTAFGALALMSNSEGWGNSAVGSRALNQNTFGVRNSAFGQEALNANTEGMANSAFGETALSGNTTGSNNSAFGRGALASNTEGGDNSAFGAAALLYLSEGSGNIALGKFAGYSLQSGSDNIYIGSLGSSTESSTIRIGGNGHSATYIAGIYGSPVSGSAVYVNSDGQLGTMSSSRRYKEQIADMDAESDVLLRLRPVSFYYRPELDAEHARQYGLVAEEVAEVAPGLVDYDKDGQPQAVRYHFVNAMLLNEVQKQRATIERQESTIQDLETRLARLEAAQHPPGGEPSTARRR